MKELIKIKESEGGKQVVSARDLHEYLVKSAKGGQKGEMFSHWIKRMLSYDFVENVDYAIQEYDYKGNAILSKSDNQRVARREYILTLDTAKQISMIQNNDKGFEARRYFIACEKELLRPLTFEEMAKKTIMLADKRIKELESKIESDRPMVAFADTVIKSDENISMTNMAKLIGIGRNKLFETLRDKKILMSKGNYRNTPYQKYIDAGYFEMTEKTINSGLFLVTLVTPKGQVYITNKLNK